MVLLSGPEVKGTPVGDTSPTVYERKSARDFSVNIQTATVMRYRPTRKGANILDPREVALSDFDGTPTFCRLTKGPSSCLGRDILESAF